MQTRARRSSSPRTSTRTRSFDLKASDTTRHESGMIVPAGFVTRITTDPIRCKASRSSGSSCRFVLKSTRHTSGERPRATRSRVQKSPTVTTGLARPIAGRMPSPFTSDPIGHRRYSRSESGRRSVASANSANAEGELPVDMDAHLLCDLGPWVIHDDHVALPVLRCLVPAQRTLVLVRDRGTVLARLWYLYNHDSPFLPGAALRSRAVLFDPVEFAEGRLAHREADLRLPRRPFVQGDRDDPRPDLVADPQIALRVLPDEPLSFLVHVDPIVHDLRDVQEAVQGTESHESAELKDFHHRTFDDLLESRREHEGVVLHPLVHRAIAMDNATLAHPLDVARDQRERFVRPDLALEGRARELACHRIDVLPQAFRRDPDDVLSLDPLIHENPRGSYQFHLFSTLRPALFPPDFPYKSCDPPMEGNPFLGALPDAFVYLLMGIRTYLNSIGRRRTPRPGFSRIRTSNENRAGRNAVRARGVRSRGAKQERPHHLRRQASPSTLPCGPRCDRHHVLLHPRGDPKSMRRLGGGPRHRGPSGGVHRAIWTGSPADRPILALLDQPVVGRLGSQSPGRSPGPPFHLLRLPRDPRTCPCLPVHHDRHRDSPRRRRRERGGTMGGPLGQGLLPERLGHAHIPGGRRPRDCGRPGDRPPDERGLRQYAAVSSPHPHVGARRPVGPGFPCGWRRISSLGPPRLRVGPAESWDRDPDDEDVDAGGPPPRFRQDSPHEGPVRLRRPLQACASELPHLDGDDPWDHGRRPPLRDRRD